jgi:outer membrane receptor for ferrienterochelin and colicin
MNHVSYGVEALSNININEKHSFVLSYTLSKSTMQNDSVNLGLLYPTSYDRPHNFNLLYSFKYKRFTFTSTFTWQSGRVATVPLFVAYANATPIYSLRNEYRLKPFHKMDIGFQYSFRNKGKVKQFLNVNLYNVYSRKNTYAVIWGDINNTRIPEFKYLTAFPILPSFSYSIKF